MKTSLPGWASLLEEKFLKRTIRLLPLFPRCPEIIRKNNFAFIPSDICTHSPGCCCCCCHTHTTHCFLYWFLLWFSSCTTLVPIRLIRQVQDSLKTRSWGQFPFFRRTNSLIPFINVVFQMSICANLSLKSVFSGLKQPQLLWGLTFQNLVCLAWRVLKPTQRVFN